MGLNLRLMKLNSNFQHLNKNELMDSFRMSERRLLFFDYEGTLQECEYKNENAKSQHTPNCAPSTRLMKLLTALSSDPRNTIFIISGSQKNHLDEWFSSIPNICLAAEYGFYYKICKSDGDCEWKELLHIKDWSWKDSILKILEGFTEKTEGSFIAQKEASISWFYKDCDIYFGNVQANEIKTHLQNIFENCKLDFVNGKGYLEIKPQNVNKGYFLSHILMQKFTDKVEPDFIFAIGDGTSDEEMFNYLNSVNNQLTYLKPNIKMYTCTIARKPSNAKYYLNEIYEVLEYLESLNQTHHIRKDTKKKSSTRSIQEPQVIFRNRTPNSISAIDINSLSNLNI